MKKNAYTLRGVHYAHVTREAHAAHVILLRPICYLYRSKFPAQYDETISYLSNS